MLNKKAMIKTAVASVAVLMGSVSFAMPGSGPYVGAQLGYGNIQGGYADDYWFGDLGGVAGRIFGGYSITPNWAVELGWTKFGDMSEDDYWDNVLVYSSKTKTSAPDLVLKGTIPVSASLSLYGKAGFAYLMTSTKVETPDFSETINKSQLDPTFGVGASYAFSPQVAADLSYTRIQESGGTNLGSTNFYGVGLTYSFDAT